MNAIEINGLVKSFGKQHALNGIDLTVKKGEIYGFIGPNGAGKSTTIRILLGMIRKNAGEVHLLGGDPFRDSVSLHKRLAYVPGDTSLWPDLTGGEAIDFLCRLQGDVNKERCRQLLDRFELDPRKKCRSYSKGNRQKVALIAAFAVDSELLILDEPTNGLDPLMEKVFQDYIREAKNQGKTVFLSSHILAEVELLCDHIGIIRQGKIVESGSLKQLRHLIRTTITVELVNPQPNFPQNQFVKNGTLQNGKWQLSIDETDLAEVMRLLAPMGIRSLVAEPPTLEELFLCYYENGHQAKEGDPQ